MLAESAYTHAPGLVRLAFLPTHLSESCLPQPEIKGGRRLLRNLHGKYLEIAGREGIADRKSRSGGIRREERGGGCFHRCGYLNFSAVDRRSFGSILYPAPEENSANSRQSCLEESKLCESSLSLYFAPRPVLQNKVLRQAVAY